MSQIQKIIFTGTLGVLVGFSQVGLAQELTTENPQITARQAIEQKLAPSNKILKEFSDFVKKGKHKNFSDFQVHLTSSVERVGSENSIGSLEFNVEAKLKDSDSRLDDKNIFGSLAIARGIPCELGKEDASTEKSHLVIEARIPMNALDYLKVVAQRASENDTDLHETESNIVQSILDAQNFAELGARWDDVIVKNLGAKESAIWEAAGSRISNGKELKVVLNFDSQEKIAMMPEINRLAKSVRMKDVEKSSISLRMHEDFISFNFHVCGNQDAAQWNQNTDEVLGYSKKFDKQERARHQALAAVVMPEIIRVLTGEGFHNSVLLKIK